MQQVLVQTIKHDIIRAASLFSGAVEPFLAGRNVCSAACLPNCSAQSHCAWAAVCSHSVPTHCSRGGFDRRQWLEREADAIETLACWPEGGAYRHGNIAV